MKLPIHFQKHYLIFVFYTLCCIQLVVAQNFDRVEVFFGFGDLENNNGVAVADYDADLDLDIFVVAIKKDVGRGLNRDSSEQAVELESAEVLDEIARVTQAEFDRVNEQIARLKMQE